ncbi:hypothetical protein R3X26_09505 [Vibrio sp. TH_r3]|uniref:hypothetical protein n=1 Tax=Vibrio sp. TH_r3 TaxID=3082084 RepID=UPI002955583C|nr:hypothetical protein [Vibrio sp. TH_r3]MDV7104629.1 hypothetical protein [Vibrio sp. TH_r3]
MHICFSITAHGFGHGAISCSVINQVIKEWPDCKITVLSKLPVSYLNNRIRSDFTHISIGHDFGMLMDSPIKVNEQESRRKYSQLLKDWDRAVASEKRCLATINPDLLISNISPISLEAAKLLGIKTASVAPFDWAQIYRAYCLDDTDVTSHRIYKKMCDVYACVDHIFKPTPHVPNINHHEINIGSIASQPEQPSSELFAAPPFYEHRSILFALGGFAMPITLSQLPQISGWQWLVDQKVPISRTDLHHLEDLPFSFLQLLASSDVIITKPGYGSYCEIAALAKYKKVRVLSLTRPDWPETPYLNAFLRQHVPFLEIELSHLEGNKLAQRIFELSQLPYPETLPYEDGAEDLVNYLKRNIFMK